MSTTTTDPIADMLTRIRNAIAVRKHEVSLPHSNIKESVAKLLKDSNFIDDVKVDKAPVGKTLTIRINAMTAMPASPRLSGSASRAGATMSMPARSPCQARPRRGHSVYKPWSYDRRPGQD